MALIGVLAAPVAFSGDGTGGAAGSELLHHDVGVDYCVPLGPPPVAISETGGAYLWVACKIVNLSDHDDAVQVTPASDLLRTAVPDGCTAQSALLVPGRPNFVLLAGEQKSVLYRTKYECHAPAGDALVPMALTFAIDHREFFPDEDDSNTANDSVTLESNLVVGTPQTEPPPPPSSPGGMMAMSIDADPTGNAATDLGPREDCVEAPAGASVTVDVTAEGIPLYVDKGTPSDTTDDEGGAIAWAFLLRYSEAHFSVMGLEPHYLLAAGARSNVFSFPDIVPDTNENDRWLGAALDVGGGAPESGSGVLARLIISVEDFAPSGLYPLLLSRAVHFDAAGNAYSPHEVAGAYIAVGRSCEPLEIGVQLDAIGSAEPRDGTAAVTFAISCSRPVLVGVTVDIRQRRGWQIVHGSSMHLIPCEDTTSSTVSVEGAGKGFVAGNADVIVAATAESVYATVSAPVKLRGGRP